jgi:hypothetical protein
MTVLTWHFEAVNSANAIFVNKIGILFLKKTLKKNIFYHER